MINPSNKIKNNKNLRWKKMYMEQNSNLNKYAREPGQLKLKAIQRGRSYPKILQEEPTTLGLVQSLKS